MRIINKFLLIYTFYLFLGFSLISCTSKIFSQNLNVEKIVRPEDLPDDVKNLEFILVKNVLSGSDIIIHSLDKTNKIEIHLEYHVREIDLSKNGDFCVYTAGKDKNDVYSIIVHIYDIEKGTDTKILGWDKDIATINLSGPKFTKDGENVVLIIDNYLKNSSSIGIIGIDGSGLRIINHELPFLMAPVLSTDGRKILVTCIGDDENNVNSSFQLCEVYLDDGSFKYLTSEGSYYHDYVYSPDGKRIAYSQVIIDFPWEIMKQNDSFNIMEVDGSNPVRLLNWTVKIIGFTDSGEDIVFLGRRNERSTIGLYLIDFQGKQLRHLTYFDEILEEWYADVDYY